MRLDRIGIIGAGTMGSGIAQAALWAGQRRRGLAVQLAVGAGIVVGSFLGGIGILGFLFSPSGFGLYFVLPFLLYVGLAAGSPVAWLR